MRYFKATTLQHMRQAYDSKTQLYDERRLMPSGFYDKSNEMILISKPFLFQSGFQDAVSHAAVMAGGETPVIISGILDKERERNIRHIVPLGSCIEGYTSVPVDSMYKGTIPDWAKPLIDLPIFPAGIFLKGMFRQESIDQVIGNIYR